MITKLSLDIPPNSMFQPVTSDFMNNITFTEYLLGVLNKVNECVEEINRVSAYITDFDTKYQELLTEFNELRTEFDGLKEDILTSVNAELTAFKTVVDNEINQSVAYLKAYSDANDAILDNKIEQITLGDIELIDPTTGVLSPLQDVINNIAGVGRDGLTATEYDTLELTATTYDGYAISAYDYDYHGKTILTA